MYVPVCVVYANCVQVPEVSEEDVGFPGAGFIGSCEVPEAGTKLLREW